MKFPTVRTYAMAALLSASFMAAHPLSASEGKIKIPVPPIPPVPKIVLKAPPVPKIVLPVPPPMIWLPGPQVYVAHDSPHEIFYRDGQYYLFHGNVWYVSHAYNGPWRHIHVHYVPRGIRGYRHEYWGRYQDEADHHFRDERYRHERHPFYAGRPHDRARWRDYDERRRHLAAERHERRDDRHERRDDRHERRDDRHERRDDRHERRDDRHERRRRERD